MLLRKVFAVGLALVCAGCQHLNPNDTHPVLTKTFGPNKAADVGEAIAITSNRRVVIVMVKPSKADGTDGEWGKFCAEPPPDTAIEQQSTFKAILEGKVQRPGTEGTGKGELTSEELRFLTSLFKRSQGAQLFRDGLYSLCQLHANGALSSSDVRALYDELLKQAAGRIDLELQAQSSATK